MGEHRKCAACGILIGAHHMESAAITTEGRDVCWPCHQVWKKHHPGLSLREWLIIANKGEPTDDLYLKSIASSLRTLVDTGRK